MRLLSDEQLIQRYSSSGEPECLAPIYERYSHLVLAVCMKYLGNVEEAEDTAMAVFSKLFEELRKSEVQMFKNWLLTVTRNQCLMQLRHRKTVERSRQEILYELEADVMERDTPLHLHAGNGEEDVPSVLENAIEKLNEAQRQCIRLFYLEERSYKEVADTTGYSMNEVKSHLQNGRRNLKIFLEKVREE